MSFIARGGYNRWCNESPCHNKRRNIMAKFLNFREAEQKLKKLPIGTYKIIDIIKYNIDNDTYFFDKNRPCFLFWGVTYKKKSV